MTHLTTAATDVGGATFVSRLLGFFRDILLAKYFGTGATAEAFVVAFRIPNLFRELVAEGAASAAFVPTLGAAQTRHDPARWEALVRTLVTTVALLLGVAVVGAILAAPWLVRLLAPGFVRDAAKWELTVTLTRVLLPYLWMMGLVAVTTSALHVLQHFRVPAWNPALMNVGMIVACLVWVPRVPAVTGMVLVAVSILIAGALQIGLNHAALWRYQVRLRPQLDWHLPELRQIQRLLLPRLFGAAVYQLGVLLDTVMASLAWIVGAGGVAALYYANRLIQFPLGLFGISMATVSLPTLAHQAARQELDLFRTTLLVGIRSVTAVMLPAMVGLCLLAQPIVEVLFQRGAFTVASTQMTSWVLQWSAVGLWAFAVTKLLVNAHYALHDTRTPVRWAAWGLGLNVVFNLLLMWPMGVGGLALGTSLAACIECIGLWRHLERRVGPLDRTAWWTSLRRVGGASVLMGGWTWGAWQMVTPSGWGLGCVVATSVLVYLGLARWWRAEELAWFVQRLSKRA